MAEPRNAALIDPGMLETLSDAEIAHTLKLDIPGIVDVAQTIAQNPNSTIEPARHESHDTQGKRALEVLGEQRAERGITAGLDIDRTIGEGGMGIVRLATQRSLGRPVAVKTLRPNTKSEAAALRLLREAWVTGSLEHPNIVPVYDLGLDDDGLPIIVLKRIEGVEWATVIADEAAAREKYGAADLLEHNLRILVQLCNAVSLAHARGVLHRDLKPENVMIGSFGEVYLVDWGIAVSLREDPLNRLPLASEAKEMAGTPTYMAPEMLGALGALSERTDVYLLGAILYEILTGAPPHVGTFKQIVGSILLSHFEYPPHVPKELAAIATKAMRREPAERYASADELKQRLEWYLRHRGYLALAVAAQKRLDEMKQAVEHGSKNASDVELRDRLYHLFAEARFGFRQAIGACEDNDLATKGLREAIETVVLFELERGTAEAAAAALAELDDPPPELTKRVNEAFRAREAERRKIARLERMQAELDPTIGRRTRVAATTFSGLAWTIMPQFAGFMEKRHPVYPHWMMYAWSFVALGVGALVLLWGRESLSKTAVNRQLVTLTILTFTAQLALEVGCVWLGLPLHQIYILHLLVWGAMLTTFAVGLDRRFFFAVGMTWLSFFVAARHNELVWDGMSCANFSLVVTILVAWWRPREDRPRYLAMLAEREEKRKLRRPDDVS